MTASVCLHAEGLRNGGGGVSAWQGFVKDLAEVADNLQRAAATVPGSVLEGKDADGQPLSPERALALLQSLLQGVHLTDRVLQQVQGFFRVLRSTTKPDPTSRRCCRACCRACTSSSACCSRCKVFYIIRVLVGF